VNTSGGLFRDTLAALGDLVPLVSFATLEKSLDDAENDLELGVVRRARIRESSVLEKRIFGFLTLVNEKGHVSTIIDDEIRPVALAVIIWPSEGVEGAFPVLLEGFSLPGKDSGRLITSNSGGCMVLSGENVARAPSDVASEGLEGLDQDGSLNGHVERSRDTSTLEGDRRSKLSSTSHETRHLNLSQLNVLATVVGKGDISNYKSVIGLDTSRLRFRSTTTKTIQLNAFSSMTSA
jgi:hypothetical protein